MSDLSDLSPFRVPRSEWPNGPWDVEPDRVDFEHAGLPCLALRGPWGQWCGYVAVPPEHPLHGLHYDHEQVAVEVHGGLTYANFCADHICRVPKPGESDNVYWFGFDCAHVFDLAPVMMAYELQLKCKSLSCETYRDLDYVKSEICKLADQLAAVK